MADAKLKYTYIITIFKLSLSGREKCHGTVMQYSTCAKVSQQCGRLCLCDLCGLMCGVLSICI